ncbi:hypothetical protein Cantr_03104 [Candida viswanathii]|uniref:Magnesium transporter NIPA8 n=1 Tax=Candida viswanathii TaxID=5486 RepID=A0A367YS55_9ASCO|nr:hypothetical protein Cantr_03104 [Candida viswanathii]
MSSTSSIILGCSVAVVSSGIQSLGITLQRKSHLLHIQYLPLDAPPNEQQINIIHLNHQQQKYKRNMWLFGFLLFIVANVLGSIIQISTLPLIILSPLQSIGLIFNSLLSCMLLPGDHFTNKLWLGTGIIAVGASIIAYNGNVPPLPQPDPLPNIDERFHDILVKLSSPGFVVWFVGTFVLMGALLLVNYIYLNKRILLQPITIRNNQIIKCNKYQFMKGVNYGIISGTLTAHTFLFAKSLIDVIIETILHEKFSKIFSISNSLPYLLLAVMLAIVGLQLTAFNLGLAQITTGILYPLCFLIYNLINLINDLIFNSLIASHRMSISQLMWVIFGLVGVLCGVVILSWDSAFNGSEEEEADVKQDENDLIRMKFPYNSNRSNLLGNVDEFTGLVGEPSSTSSDISLDINKSHSSIDDINERQLLDLIHEEEEQEDEMDALIELTDEAVNVSMISSHPSANYRLSFEQSQLLNLLELRD